MSILRLLFAAMLALGSLNVALAAQGSVRNGLRADLLGCYALFRGTGERVDSSFFRATPIVRLDSTVHPVFVAHKEFGARRLLKRLDASGHHVDPAYPLHLGPAWWLDSLSDSVRLAFF